MNVQKYLETTLKGDWLPEADIQQLLWKILEILVEEPNVLMLSSPINVCGDVHGQFYDVKFLFQQGGPVPDKKYLFLGDYVDRGYYSLETITLLFCYKVLYPDRIYMLRGNHECRMITQNYGFYGECQRKYGRTAVWSMFMDVFDHLPTAAVIDNHTFCVHGGLSPSIPNIDAARVINRVREIPADGPYADLMWSDPAPTEGSPSWEISPRGAGYMFGIDPVDQFLYINDLTRIVRAHQTANAGYEINFGGKCITVWSAPNYCYRCGNKASVMQLDGTAEPTFIVYNAVPNDQRVLPPQSFLQPYSFYS